MNNLINYYNMLREFNYEKNGLVNSITFLEYMIDNLLRIYGGKNE